MRGREAALLRGGEEVARVLDLPWEGTDPDHWRTAARAEGRIVLAGRLGPDNVRDGDRRRAAVGGRRSLVARVLAGNQGPRQGEAIRGGSPLMTCDRSNLRPLRRPLRAGDADPGARRADGGLGRGARRPLLSRGGRAPRPHLHRAAVADHPRAPLRAGQAALPEARGSQPHRGAQDQQRARPGRAGAAARQDADHRRDRRRASTASRQRRRARASGSSVSSSWAPRTCGDRLRTSSACT